MEMMLILVSLAIAAIYKGVQGVISYDVGVLCTSTLAPTIPLPPETLLLNFTTSLTLTRVCVIHFTAEDNLVRVIVDSKPDPLTGVSFPCNWLSVVYGINYEKVPNHKYACISDGWNSIYWLVDDIKEHDFMIVVNATTGIQRTGDFSLILTKYYRHCTNYSESGRPIFYCCHHGVNDSLTDYAVCDETYGIYRCLRREMFCDGVVNCLDAQDEDGCVGNDTKMANSAVVRSGGAVGVWVVVGVGIWVVM